jgi:hypothetical protein
MPRSAANEAQAAQKTAGNNAATSFGPLNAGANELVNSQGFDPTTLAAITNAGMGGVNANFGSAAGQVQRTAARSKNPAAVAENLDTLAQDKGIAGGQEAGNIQIANEQFKNQQRTQGLNLLNSMYGTSTNAQAPLINAQTNASPGWVQSLTGVLGAINGAGAKGVKL